MARSSTTSRSSVQAPVDRYFHPPSAETTTIVPGRWTPAVFAAPAKAAPDESPAKIPTSISRRVHSIDSRGRTMLLPSRSSAPLFVDEDGRDVAVVEVAEPVDHLAGRWLDGPHLDVGILLLQVAADTEQGARRAQSGHEVGDLGAVPPDLGSGALVVGLGIGRVGVLVEEGPLGVLGGQCLGPSHRAVGPLGAGRLDDLGPPRPRAAGAARWRRWWPAPPSGGSPSAGRSGPCRCRCCPTTAR